MRRKLGMRRRQRPAEPPPPRPRASCAQPGPGAFCFDVAHLEPGFGTPLRRGSLHTRNVNQSLQSSCACASAQRVACNCRAHRPVWRKLRIEHFAVIYYPRTFLSCARAVSRASVNLFASPPGHARAKGGMTTRGDFSACGQHVFELLIWTFFECLKVAKVRGSGTAHGLCGGHEF